MSHESKMEGNIAVFIALSARYLGLHHGACSDPADALPSGARAGQDGVPPVYD